jgi:beta-glucanase (GH16 family)
VTAANCEGFDEPFVSLNSARWAIAHYDFSHPSFDTDWRGSQVTVQQGLTLGLAPQQGGLNRFVGGSIRTLDTMHYGRYSVQMQPAKGAGVVTGFFTYTGPFYGTRHDEIDIEFLGKDTTKLHLAWFLDGNLREKTIDLGFDAATCVHTYEFDWHPKGIDWFVNGRKVYGITADIPRIPGRLYANIWAADPSIAAWAGRTDRNTEAQAFVRSISFRPREKPES